MSARTEYSQTFANPDGTSTTQFFASPAFYQPAGSTTLEPIVVGFEPDGTDGAAFTSTQAPVAVAVFNTSAADDFLSTTYGGQSIGFRLPSDLANGGSVVKPTVVGPVADYSNILPGIDLRVIANAHGAKSFFIWQTAPNDPTLRYVVDAPGLTLKSQDDGSIAIVDAKGAVVATIPKPYAVDSTADPLTGSGHFADGVTLSVGPDGKTVTVRVDPTWLKTAVYPVYVDPSTGWIYNAGSSAYGDAFVDSYVPTTNFGDYQRPDSPYYHELWNGVDPGGGGGTMYDFMRWDLSAYAGVTVDAATLRLDPYHQYYSAPTTETTYLRRLTATWTEGGVTWNTKPTYTTTNGTSAACVEGNLCYWAVTAIAQQWLQATSPTPNYGFQLDTIGFGTTYWKRFIASEQGGTNVPALTITYHVPTATPTAKLTFTGDRTFSWAYADSGGDPESKYQVQLSSDGGATWPAALDSGQLSGSATTWTAPASMALSDLTAYTWHVRAYNGTSWSTFSANSSFTYDAYERGNESYYTRVPFDLGGGWNLGVGVHNGEASLSRTLFSIPAIGPSPDLQLAYNSTDLASAGPFGYGWSSNLTQSLWLNNTTTPTLIIWKRADGGRVAFSGSGATWTAVPGHFETLSYAGSPTYEYTLTEKDQTKLVFESTGAYRLKRIVDRFGKTLTLMYPTGSIVATDATGRVTALALDASQHVSTATDVAGRVWTFAVNTSSADLTSITDPAGKSTTLGYSSHRLTTVSRLRTPAVGSAVTVLWSIGYTGALATSVTDPVNATVSNTFTYNSGNTVVGLLKTYSPLVRSTATFSFDSLGRPTAIIDRAGFTTTRSYDAHSNLTQEVRPISVGPPAVGQTVTYTYDSRGNVLTATAALDASTTDVTAYSYSSTNDVLTRSEADNDTSAKVVTKYGFDAGGHLTSVDVNCTTTGTTPPSTASTCSGAGTQDASTNLVSTLTYTANDQLLDETDPLGRVIRHAYDTWGNETSVTQNFLSGQSATSDRNVINSRAYDQAQSAGRAGLPTSLTDAIGTTTTDAYDPLGRLVSESLPGDSTIPALTMTKVYDEFGNVLTETSAWTAVTRTATYVYDNANRDTSINDPTGVLTSTGYDASGDAVQSTAGGISTSRTFDGLGHTLTETISGVTTTHVYDGAGNELQTVDPAGVTTNRVFDRAGRLLSQTIVASGGNVVTSHIYDRLDREVSMTDPTGAVTTTTYDRAGRTLSSTVAGALSSNAYDRAGNLLSTKNPGGDVGGTVVDGLDRSIKTIANCTNSGSTQPAAGIVCTGSGIHDDGTNLVNSIWYDAAGDEIAGSDPSGIASRSFIDVRGLAWETIANCTNAGTTPPADPSTCTGAGTADPKTNLVTTVAFDGGGAEVTTVRSVGNGTNATTDTAYDASGHEVAARDPLGTITRTFYDANGRLTTTVIDCTTSGTTIPSDWINCTGGGTQNGTYNVTTSVSFDSRGNKASETAPNGRVTTFTYDDANRLITQTENYTAGSPAADQNLTTYFAYDDAGRQVAVRAPTADRTTFTVTRYLFDAAGRLAAEITNCTSTGTAPPGDPAWKTCTGGGTADAVTNLRTDITYDARGNKLAVTSAAPYDAATGSQHTVTTRYAYDAADRTCRVLEDASVDLQTLTNPCSTAVSGTATSNVSTEYTYDDAGNLATMIDGRGNTTTYGFDAIGRMTSLTDANNKTVSSSYDALGNRLSQANRDNTTVTWTYDGAGRPLTRAGTGVATVTYTYDADGNRLTAGDGTRMITTTYDRLNRPLSVAVSDDAGAATTYTYSQTTAGWTDPTGSYLASLDALGREISLADPIHGSSQWTSSYRADGQAATLAAPNGNTTTSSYDPSGRPTGSMTTAGATTRASYTYVLNRAGQRVSEDSEITTDPTNGLVTFTYDPLGQITGYSGSPVTSQTYGWAAVPDRTTKQVGTSPTVTTTYDAANRPTSDSAGGTYSADADGRLTALPGQQLVWDSLGRLLVVKDGSGTVISTYTYDPLDRLASATRGSAVTRFRYVGTSTTVAQARDGSGAVLWNVVNGLGGQARMDFGPGGSNQRFYGTNGHGDLTWTASSSGPVSATIRSDPWGVPGTSSGGSLPDLRFQGSWADTATNLSWAVKRWYAPSLGEFISEDALLGQPSQPGSRNLYAYGEGDPIGRTDTGGQDWCAYYSPCTLNTLYEGKLSSYWTGYFSVASGWTKKGQFFVDDFIKTKWASSPVWGLPDLKGDWRGFQWPGSCLESRACLTVDLAYGYASLRVRPTCARLTFLFWPSDSDYICSNANAINTWYPFQSAAHLYRLRDGGVHVSWSLNQSSFWGVLPIDGYIEIHPPTATSAGFLKMFYDGYPSTGVFYRRGPYWTWKVVDLFSEQETYDLGSFWGDQVRQYAWPY